jgi:hypothetical protein
LLELIISTSTKGSVSVVFKESENNFSTFDLSQAFDKVPKKTAVQFVSVQLKGIVRVIHGTSASSCACRFLLP